MVNMANSKVVEIGADQQPQGKSNFKRYKVSNDRVRETILGKIASLKLSDCESMVDYINKHSQYKHDLRKAEHTYTDDQIVTNIMVGLPTNYRGFKKQYDWVRSANADVDHDLDFLFDRLLIEEEDQKRIAVFREDGFGR